MLENKKPLLAKNLKIIEYVGILYATFDGERIWEIDRGTYAVMRMCDGKKTVKEIAKEIAEKIDSTVEDVLPTLERILTDLEKHKFITFL
ncbi:MAG TPA: PqqD family peptide modification chaperone [Candidatus Aenigmarchaeota archaeon]|nr:PqqD family peptide modification chaperone [Candidatus Aenigmarchaeota archaeon]